jgi:GH24 family phage-related lysozyme (muramidase)
MLCSKPEPVEELRAIINVQLTAGQWLALMNLWEDVKLHQVQGPCPSLATSKLIQYLNKKHFQLASAEMLRWSFKGGGVCSRTHRQRQEDRKLLLRST